MDNQFPLSAPLPPPRPVDDEFSGFEQAAPAPWANPGGAGPSGTAAPPQTSPAPVPAPAPVPTTDEFTGFEEAPAAPVAPAAPAAPAPAAPNSVTQQVIEGGKGIIPGAISFTGTSLKGVAATGKIGEHNARDFAVKQLTVFEQIDAGVPVPDADDPVGYQYMTPEQRAAMKRDYTATVQALPAIEPLSKSPLFQVGNEVEKVGKELWPAAPGYEESIGRQIGEGLGSMVPLLATAPLPGGGLIAGGLGLAAGTGEAVDRAIKGGATEDQVLEVAKYGAAAGSTDLLPIEVLLGRVPLPGGKFIKVPLNRLGDALRYFGRVGRQALVEGGQEATQTLIQNFGAQEVYKPDQPLFEGAGGDFTIGGIIGGVVEAVIPGRGRHGAPAPTTVPFDATPPAPGVPPAPGTGVPPGAGVPPGGGAAPPPGVPPGNIPPQNIPGNITAPQNVPAGATPGTVLFGADPGDGSAPPVVNPANPVVTPGNVVTPPGSSGLQPLSPPPVTDPAAPGAAPYTDPAAINTPSKLPAGAAEAAQFFETLQAPTVEAAEGPSKLDLTELINDPRKLPEIMAERDAQQAASDNATAFQDTPRVLEQIKQQVATDPLPAPSLQGVTDPLVVRQEIQTLRGQIQALTETGLSHEGDKSALYNTMRGLQAAELRLAELQGVRGHPVPLDTPADVNRNADVTAMPTQAQAEAGNYSKRKLSFKGLGIHVETEAGTDRNGVGADGRPWSVTMRHPYGGIDGTVGKDGDPVDVTVGPNPNSPAVYIVDQIDPDTGKWDEHKTFVGFNSEAEARAAYESQFSDGRGAERMGAIQPVPAADFKRWVKDPKATSAPFAYNPSRFVKPTVKKARKPDSRQPKNVLEHLAQAGGIMDTDATRGELRARDLHNKFVPGYGRLVRKNGMPLDEAREFLVERGFLNPGASTDDLLNLLEEVAFPRSRTADAEQDPAQAAHEAEGALQDALAEMGFSAQDIDQVAFDRAVDLILSGQSDLESAYEQAVMEAADQVSGIAEEIEAADIEFPGDWSSASIERDEVEGGEGDPEGGAEVDRGFEGPGDEMGEGPRDYGEGPEEDGDGYGAEWNEAPPEGSDDSQLEAGPAAPDVSISSPSFEDEKSDITFEPGADGKQQAILPGAERIGQGEQAKRKAEERLKPRVAQSDVDGLALFGDSRNQTDLLDQIPATPELTEPERRAEAFGIIEKLKAIGTKNAIAAAEGMEARLTSKTFKDKPVDPAALTFWKKKLAEIEAQAGSVGVPVSEDLELDDILEGDGALKHYRDIMAVGRGPDFKLLEALTSRWKDHRDYINNSGFKVRDVNSSSAEGRPDVRNARNYMSFAAGAIARYSRMVYRHTQKQVGTERLEAERANAAELLKYTDVNKPIETFRFEEREAASKANEADTTDAAPAATEAAPAATPKKGWTQIGVNASGNPVWEDARGVRSYTENGIRVSEKVGVNPGGGTSLNLSDRGSDFEPAPSPTETAVSAPAELSDPTAWWNDELTKEGRRALLEAANLKHPASMRWGTLPQASKDKLLAARSTVAAETTAKPVGKPDSSKAEPHPGLVIKSLQTGKETTIPVAGEPAPIVNEDGGRGGEGIKTPGTNLTWTTLSDWLQAAKQISLRPSSETRHQQLRAHLVALGENLDLIRQAGEGPLVNLLHQVGKGHTFPVPPRGARGGTVWETINQLATDRMAQLKREADKDSIPSGDNAPKTRADFVDDIKARLEKGDKFTSITQVRQIAKQFGVTDLKQVDEAVELALVELAREIAREPGPNPAERFDALLDLYERQPTLGTRTSTSVANQAYSTPLPLAFVASRLAEVTGTTPGTERNPGRRPNHVYEPTAGNGALLIEAEPIYAAVNELDPTRRGNLKAQGFLKVTGQDAAAENTAGSAIVSNGRRDVDVVIANPPFGAVRDERGKTKRFKVSDRYETNEIDHAISFRALEAMKGSGSAVLILGGVNKLTNTEEGRSDAYNGKAKREFYWNLYNTYNVVDHFTVSGDLYAKQGAGWPVDVIVIRGRGKSSLPLPAVSPPRILSTWGEVKGLLDAQYDGRTGRVDGRAGELAGRDGDGGPSAGNDGDRASVRVGEPPARPGSREDGSGSADGVRPGRDRDERDAGRGPELDGAGAGATSVESDGSGSTGADLSVGDIFDQEFEKLFGSTEEKPSAPAENQGLLDTAVAGSKAWTGPDGRGWRIKKEGDGFIVLRMPPRDGTTGKPPSGELPQNYRPEKGTTWTQEQAAAEAERLANQRTTTTAKAAKAAPTEAAPGSITISIPTQVANGFRNKSDSEWTTLADGRSSLTPAQAKELLAMAKARIKAGAGDLGWQSVADQIERGQKLNFTAEEVAELKNGKAKPTVGSAVKSTVMGLDEVASGLTALFGGGKTIGSGLNFDEDTYKAALPFFRAGVTHFKAAASDVATMIQELLKNLSEVQKMARETIAAMKPYIVRFVQDVRSGAVSLLEPIAQSEAQAETTTALEGKDINPAGKPAPKQTRAAEDKSKIDTSARQVDYKPRSSGKGMGTLVPVNMQTAVGDALARLEKEVGDIDEYVARELGIPREELDGMLGAEQIDGVALGIYNFSKGSGMIVGDQTGIGKGRQVAAVLRWALKNGKVPIFVTEKPNLYADMYRDLVDVGVEKMLGRPLKMLMTNSGESIPLSEDGKVVLKSQGAGPHKLLLKRMTNAGALDGYDMVFSTYAQMQTVKEQETERMSFLRAMAANNGVLVLDEAHNAGGQAKSERGGDDDKMTRAIFARELTQLASAVLYSSATYAKRPDVMDLYFKTDMRYAVDDPTKLGELISAGGVPMQQIVAAMLSKAGQYVRRERSFDGVAYDTPVVPVDRDTYEGFSASIKLIQDFSEGYVQAATKAMDKRLKAQAQGISRDNATGTAGASSTNFTSIMHNVINNLLAAIKAQDAATRAITALQSGEKPVITLANTNETFFKEYAEENDIAIGDTIDLSFGSLLERYLERSRTITVKEPGSKKGESIQLYLTDEDLGPAGVAAFKRAQSQIRKAAVSSLPVSPIDFIRAKLTEAGYTVGEITGRTVIINYGADGQMVLAQRPGAEKSITGRRQTITDYNSGKLDVIILNQAGSTGLSLHASEKVKDQRKRHMIIAQAEGNIDTHMQMLGRVHRTGQVVVPRYSQLVADVPAEKRPAAVLAKKMASLNASTTASRDSAVTAKDTADFMNAYGDKVAAAVMRDNPEVHVLLGSPLSESDKGGLAYEDAARKVTGRIPLLPLAKQEEVYAQLESEYTSLLAQLEATGQNTLEAKTLELDAKLVDRKQVKDAQAVDSPFADGVYFETVDAKRLGKPMSSAQVREKLAEELEIDTATATLPQMARDGWSQMQEPYRQASNDFRAYKKELLDDIEKDTTRANAEARLTENQRLFDGISGIALPGMGVRLETRDGDFHGVILKVSQPGSKPKNPLALGSWKITIALADPARSVTLPFSQVYTTEAAPQDTEGMIGLTMADKAGLFPLLDAFDDMQTERREERTIVTGNLLAGYAFVAGKGQITNFVDAENGLRQGILMPRDFNGEKFLAAAPVTFKTGEAVVRFLETVEKAFVRTTDGLAQVVKTDRGDWHVMTDAGRSKGGKYYMNASVIAAANQDFTRTGGFMRVTGTRQRTAAVVDAMIQAGATFQTTSKLEEARPISEEYSAVPDGWGGVGELDAAPPVPQEVLDEVGRIIKEVAGLDTYTAADEIRFSGDSMGAAAWGRDTDGFAAGVMRTGMSPAEDAITIALTAHGGVAIPSEGMAATAYHEAFHRVQRRFLTAQEIKVLAAAGDQLRAMVAKKTGRESASKLMVQSEVEADAFALYMTNPTAGFPSGVRGVFAKLGRMIRRVQNYLAGRGYQTWEDVFEKAGSGEMAKRGPRKDAYYGGKKMPKAEFRIIPDFTRGGTQGFLARGQYTDRILRTMVLPFLGGANARGEARLTTYLHDVAKDVLVNKKIPKNGPFGFMSPALETARHNIIDRYGQDPAYVQRGRLVERDKRALLQEAKDTIDRLTAANVGPEEAKVLQAVLTGEAVADADMAVLSEPIRQSIDQIGQEAVLLGMISRESYERNKGAYLHRVYEKHEATGLIGWTNKLLERRRHRIIGDQMKGRGIFMEVPLERLVSADPEWAKARRGIPWKGEHFEMLEYTPGAQPDVLGGPERTKPTRRIWWPADRPLPDKYKGEGWASRGRFEVRADGKTGAAGPALTLWRDYSKPEREKMGEILDARYTIAKTYMLAANDIATGRFYRDIAENEAWAQKQKPAGNVVKATDLPRGSRFSAQTDVDWIEVPTTEIGQTGGKKKWGALSGMYVRPEIWADLTELELISQPHFWRRVMNSWKLNKTARSPVTHMNNIMSNLVFMDLADIRLQDLASGLQSYIRGDEHYIKARDGGAFGADQMSAELRQKILQPVLDDLQKQIKAGQGELQARAFGLGAMAGKLFGALKKADAAMVEAYGLEDEIFRMALYRRKLDVGFTPQQAADAARKTFIDYDVRAPLVNALRQTGLPFITYTYRAIPVLAEAIAHRPWKVAKYAMFYAALNALGYAWDDDDDEVRERATLRKEEQGKSWLGIPRMIRMPWSDANGLPVFLDVRRWIPAADTFDTKGGQAAMGIPGPLQPGGPLVIAGEIAVFNKSSFTGKEITNPLTDTAGDKAAKLMAYLWKSWMPNAPWIPGSWSWDKIGNALKGAEDPGTGETYSLKEALLSSVGIKAKPLNVEKSIQYRNFEFKKEAEALKLQAMTISRDYSRRIISKTEFEKGQSDIMEKMRRLGERREAFGKQIEKAPAPQRAPAPAQ